jgi:hypothetical protein
MEGVNFKRVKNDYDNLFTDDSKKLIKLLFNDLIKEVGKNNILNINIEKNEISKNNSLIHFIQFLINKDLFN